MVTAGCVWHRGFSIFPLSHLSLLADTARLGQADCSQDRVSCLGCRQTNLSKQFHASIPQRSSTICPAACKLWTAAQPAARAAEAEAVPCSKATAVSRSAAAAAATAAGTRQPHTRSPPTAAYAQPSLPAAASACPAQQGAGPAAAVSTGSTWQAVLACRQPARVCCVCL